VCIYTFHLKPLALMAEHDITHIFLGYLFKQIA
jgi:hypothetical protein